MGDLDTVFGEPATRHADRLQIDQFVQALFRYADSDTYVSLRAFDQQDSTAPAFLIQPVQVNGDLAHIVTEATAAAERCLQAPRSIVFAPPICTFNNALRGRTQDLANGLALSIELDEGNTLAALERLTALIGQPTEVVASGSDWMDPTTGELFPKLHIHWRLSEPTRTEADHATLARVRDLAARLAGADPTGKPVVHPLRWPGSWNRKGEAAGREPRLARILSGLGSPDAEIHLVEVAEIVAEAVESAGINEPGDGKDLPASSTPEANEALLTDAFATIPNPGRTVHYDEWMRFGYAAYRAFGGSEAGREAWNAWAAKSEKYDAREQDAAWRRIGNAIRGGTAVRTVGAGTIFFHATAAGWVRSALRLFEARAPAVDFIGPPDWRAQTLNGNKGQPLRTVANALLALRHAPEFAGLFAWNQFASRLTVLRELPASRLVRTFPREISEPDITNTTDWLHRAQIMVSGALTLEAIRAVAEENAYHPVRDYLNSLTWDGTPRINHWMHDHLGCKQDELNHSISACWLIGLVARIMDPGCQFDTALVLEGRQGFKKSTALRTLADPWFTDHLPDLTHKDSLEQLQGVWLVEIAELSSFNRAETHRIKSFLTTRVDRFRPSYGRVAADFPRQCGFAGTINPGSNGYLRDETGSRRFWVVECGVEWEDSRQVDIAYLAAARDHLWAEAVHRYRNHDVWWLDTEELETAQKAAADERMEDDALLAIVQNLIEHWPRAHGERVSISIDEILGENGMKVPNSQWTRSLQIQIGFILSRLGWKKSRIQVEGKRTRRYAPSI